MTKPVFLSLIAVVCMTMQLSVSNAVADNISRSTTSVFNFQQSLAEKGNAQAQYKLASMYEFGVGTEKDLLAAQEWYTKASRNGSQESEDRLIYLEIRKNGFKRNLHATWLNKIEIAFDAGDQHSAMVLGQLYSYGIGVKKDLNESIRLLNKAGVYENPVIVYEISRVEREIKNLSRQKLHGQKKTTKAQQKEIIYTSQPPNKPPDKTDLLAQKHIDEKTEKRRRYEEVMRKLREEERIIEEQQAWSEGKK